MASSRRLRLKGISLAATDYADWSHRAENSAVSSAVTSGVTFYSHACDVMGWRPMKPLAMPDATCSITPQQSQADLAIRSRARLTFPVAISSRDIAAFGTR